MTFPTIASTANNVSAVDTTSFAVTMPDGIEAGDLLVVVISNDSTRGPQVPLPSGWYASRSAATPVTHIFWRIAAGSDSFTLCPELAEQCAARAYRITGCSATVAPEFAFAEGSANPPSLTPSWGSADTLWIVACGMDGNYTCSGYPTNYTNTGTQVSGGSSGQVGQGWATRENATTTEDPGTFTAGGPTNSVTIAIPPVDVTANIWAIAQGSKGMVSPSDSDTTSVTLPSGTNRRMFVAVAIEEARAFTATYGTVEMTVVSDGTNDATIVFDSTARMVWFELTEDKLPSDGENDLVISSDGTTRWFYWWFILNGCKQDKNIDNVALVGNTDVSSTLVASVTATARGTILACFYKNQGINALTRQTIDGQEMARYSTSGFANGSSWACVFANSNIGAGDNELIWNWVSTEARKNTIVLAIATAPEIYNAVMMGSCF